MVNPHIVVTIVTCAHCGWLHPRRRPWQLDAIEGQACIVDSGYHVLSANEAFRESYGAESSVIGKTCFAIIHGLGHPCADHPCPVKEARRTNAPVTYDHVHHDVSGETTRVRVSVSPILDLDGSINRFIHVRRSA